MSLHASPRYVFPRHIARPSGVLPRRRAGTRPQRGVTMLELLIAVGVIIVVMVIVLLGMRNLNAQMDRSALLRQAPQIRANLAGYSSADRMDFSKLTTSQAHAMGAFRPESVSKDASGKVTVRHEFGGNIFAMGFDGAFGTANGGAFTLSYTKIPAAQCAGIARGLALIADGVWIDDKNDEVKQSKPTSGIVKTPGSIAPLDVAELAQACTVGDGKDTVTVHALMMD